MPIDKEKIKQALDLFQNDKLSDCEDILRGEFEVAINDKKNSFFNLNATDDNVVVDDDVDDGDDD